jgi:hypothetical protein
VTLQQLAHEHAQGGLVFDHEHATGPVRGHDITLALAPRVAPTSTGVLPAVVSERRRKPRERMPGRARAPTP